MSADLENMIRSGEDRQWRNSPKAIREAGYKDDADEGAQDLDKAVKNINPEELQDATDIAQSPSLTALKAIILDKSRDYKVRETAIKGLMRIARVGPGEELKITGITDILANEEISKPAMVTLMNAVEKVNNTTAAQSLVKLLKYKDADIRILAAELLGKMGKGPQGFVVRQAANAYLEEEVQAVKEAYRPYWIGIAQDNLAEFKDKITSLRSSVTGNDKRPNLITDMEKMVNTLALMANDAKARLPETMENDGIGVCRGDNV